MSIPVPVSVRLVTNRADRCVTNEVNDLSFRSTIPGGFASATLTLRRPITLQPDELGQYGSLILTDARHGGVVWEGRVEDPGRSAGGAGPEWQINALGPSAHARDRTVPLIYVDSSLERWTPSQYGSKNAVKRRDESSGGDPSVLVGVTQGTAITTSWEGDWIYRGALDAGMKLARLSTSWDAGRTDANFHVRIYFRTGAGGSPGNAASATWTTTGGTLTAVVGGTNFTLGHDVVSMRAARDASNLTAPDDNVWLEFYNTKVRTVLMTAAGVEITSGYTSNTVTCDQIVADLLGRILTRYDGAGASITAGTYPIDQLVYLDGATPGDIFDDLMALEAGTYWAAWERNVTGRHRFEWRTWPTTVRYEASVDDGFDSPGRAEGLYNAVVVRWLDAKGATKRTRVTAPVAALDAAGLVREERINAGEEIGSAAAAAQLANNFLADHSVAPNSGRLTIARPLLDMETGRMVAPWEIRPGGLIRVRGVQPRADALNGTARDGVTIFRVAGTEFRASNGTCELELDSPAVTVQRQLAKLAAHRPRPK